jgi:non-specific serine/threonine protein kinase/serine/threonine-protein kinase
MNEESLFAAALERASGAERQAFLDQACGGDAALRRRIEMLLEADERSRGILEGGTEDAMISALQGPRLAPDHLFAGRFKLRQKLGEGGMGEVWVADQSEPIERRVALKIVRPGVDSERMLARFEQERQALALMDHPNIAKVLDAGVVDGRPYFVMELIKGVPITKYCDEARLSPRERLELFIPVCHGVHHAHQKGIIHRDLKPSNILVALYDGKPVPKVIDFGVAKATGPRLTEKIIYTEVGMLIGTLEYMSPEQAELNNLDIDTRSDIYTLGVILYELLTGSLPFSRHELQAAAFTEMLRMIKEAEPPKPSTKLSGSGTLPSVAAVRQTEPKKLIALVRGELDWIVVKCLEKDRSRRYESASGLALELHRYLADEPVVAGPPSAAYRLRKFVRRNRWPVLMASVVLLLLVGGIIGTMIGLIQAQRARQAESERADGERQAKESAQRRLAQADKANEILGSVFSDLDPRNEKKEGKTLRLLLSERLVQAADQLDEEAIGDPPTVARMQKRLAQSLYGLGYPEKAVPLLLKAQATFTGYLGPDHADTLVTMDNLAVAYRTMGKLQPAIALHRETLEIARVKLGPDDPQTSTFMHNLAGCYRLEGKPDLAIRLFEEALENRKRLFGPDAQETLNTMNALGLTFVEAKKLDRAIPLLEETLRLNKKMLGSDNSLILMSLNNLAMAYHNSQKIDQGNAMLEEARLLAETSLSPNHPSLIPIMNNLAFGYNLSGKPEKALPIMQEAMTRLEKRKFEHEYWDRTFANLIDTYERLNQFEQSEAWRRKLNAMIKEKQGPEPPIYTTALMVHSQYLLKKEKWAEAESNLRECLATRQKTEPDAWKTFNTMSVLGEALTGQKKFAESESLLLKGYEGMKQRQEQIHADSKFRLTEAVERLVKLYDSWGKPDETAKWRKELEAARLREKNRGQ